MALMLQTADQTSFVDESSRRRSTFYVPLSTEDLTSDPAKDYPNLSGYSCDWSLNDSIDNSEMLRDKSHDDSNRLKRYGIVLNGSVNIDDSNLEVHANHKRVKSKNLTSSTPIKDGKACESPVKTPVKEKSKTLPVKDTPVASTFPPKSSFILKSTPKICHNYSSLSDKTVASPKKSLSFIRRTHSTKLSRNNSLLKSLTSRCVEHSNENLSVNVYDLSTERLALYLKADNCDDLVKDLFFRESLDTSTDSSGKGNKDNDDDDALSGKQTARTTPIPMIEY
jgi:hypothetical protein